MNLAYDVLFLCFVKSNQRIVFSSIPSESDNIEQAHVQ